MDFDLTATQQAVADVVTSVSERELSWDALVNGGVTALAVPERLGGDGVGLPEVATVLTEIGRHGAITPALATLGFGVLPLLDLPHLVRDRGTGHRRVWVHGEQFGAGGVIDEDLGGSFGTVAEDDVECAGSSRIVFRLIDGQLGAGEQMRVRSPRQGLGAIRHRCG